MKKLSVCIPSEGWRNLLQPLLCFLLMEPVISHFYLCPVDLCGSKHIMDYQRREANFYGQTLKKNPAYSINVSCNTVFHLSPIFSPVHHWYPGYSLNDLAYIRVDLLRPVTLCMTPFLRTILCFRKHQISGLLHQTREAWSFMLQLSAGKNRQGGFLLMTLTLWS